MADRNRNWRDQNEQDWNQNQDWRHQESSHRQNSSYGNANRNQGDEDYQNRRSEVRGSHDRYSNMSNNPYGSNYNSPYESRNRGHNQNQQQHSGYSSQNRRNEDWNRNEGWGSAGMYGGDFGREDWERGNVDYRGNQGNRYGQSQHGNWQDSNYGGYSPGFRSEQSSYRSSRDHGDFDRRRGGDDRGWWDRTRDEVSSWFGDDDAERRRNRDEQYSEGGHRGKGPKDYQRSSDRIREDVCDRLSDDDRLDATHIQVRVEGNEVVLTGTVNDRYQKRYAEDLVESISGVRNVENRIKVGGGDMASHNYTGHSEHMGGVGDESGTTNEIIRNVQNEKNKNM
jgi:osmotically-inducible protein OsmY